MEKQTTNNFKLNTEDVQEAVLQWLEKQHDIKPTDLKAVRIEPVTKSVQQPSCHPSDCHYIDEFGGLKVSVGEIHTTT